MWMGYGILCRCGSFSFFSSKSNNRTGMKKLLFATGLCVLVLSCRKKGPTASDSGAGPNNVQLTLSSPAPGFIYLDGRYTGYHTPKIFSVPEGSHVVGVALENSFSYLRKEVTLSGDTSVELTLADKPAPKIWKALWVGLYDTRGHSVTGDCSTHFSKEELDAGFDFFQWSLQNHFEKYSYGTMKWEVDRKDISVPVNLAKTSDTWYTVEPDSIEQLVPDIKPGAYDCVFIFWRESEGGCSFKSSYFGLAWTNPMTTPGKTGYVTVKFDAGANILDKINYYETTDPGVWVHEWLHTVGENFYQAKGLPLPQKAPDGFVVHAAEMYGYSFPWMNWYRDFISGRIPNPSGDPKFLGIGPEALLSYTVREAVLK